MEVKVEGLAELNELLKRTLPDHIQTKALQPTLAKAAKPIVNDARDRVPVMTGLLRRAIYSYRSRSSTKVMAVRHIGVKSTKSRLTNPFYWRFIEFGHGAIKPKYKKSLGNDQAGWFGKEIPAAPARPFMRPAFESKKLEALEVFRTNMAAEIQKAAERYSRGIVNRIRRKVGL